MRRRRFSPGVEATSGDDAHTRARRTDRGRTPSTEPDDRELVEAARQGDRDAMELLLRRHHDRFHAIAVGIVGHHDADDVAQAVLMSIVRHLDRFDGRARFTTWSHRIAVNASLDELRRRGRRPVPVELGDDRGPTRELDHRPSASKSMMTTSTPDPSEALADRQVVVAALAQLDEEFRVPLVLAEYGALEYREIAEVLDLPIGTVRSRLSRARAMLRRGGDDARREH